MTKEFKGNLPDGGWIDLNHLALKDVFEIYPQFYDKWRSRDCSNYWSFSDDTITFYIKIDTSQKPQFPISKDYYFVKPVEAIDLRISCYNIFYKNKEYLKELYEYDK